MANKNSRDEKAEHFAKVIFIINAIKKSVEQDTPLCLDSKRSAILLKYMNEMAKQIEARKEANDGK